jgi:ketosteroid isomerase-like protein
MSEENVEVVRQMVDAVNRRDLETMDAVISEEAEFNSVLAASEGRVFHGHQGIRDYFAWFDEAFEEFRSEVEEVIDAGEDRVVVLVTFTARGRESGITLNQLNGLVITFQGERIVRIDSYFHPAEALEAAGLRE